MSNESAAPIFQQREQSLRELVLIARNMPNFEAAWRNAENAVSGCEAQVWMHTEWQANGHVRLRLDSESRLVKGTLGVLQQALDGATATQIVNFDVNAYFAKIGLQRFLSPSRNNGVFQVTRQLQQRAAAYAAANA